MTARRWARLVIVLALVLSTGACSLQPHGRRRFMTSTGTYVTAGDDPNDRSGVSAGDDPNDRSGISAGDDTPYDRSGPNTGKGWTLHAQGLVAAGSAPGSTTVSLAIDAPFLLVTTTRTDRCDYDLVETWRRRQREVERPVRRVSRACTVVAPAIPVRLTLPGGETIDTVTDDNGQTAVMLTRLPAATAIRATINLHGSDPDNLDEWTEIPEAPVANAPLAPAPAATPAAMPAVSMPITAPGTTAPRLERKGLSIVRDALIECGRTAGFHGVVKLTLTLGENAKIVGVEVDKRGLQRCVAAALDGEHLPIARPPGKLEFPYAIK